jgi:polysaccharide biosynthesis protein PslH
VKILFVTPYLPYATAPHAGGLYVFAMIKGLVARGHTVSLLSLVTKDELEYVAELRELCDRVVPLLVNPVIRNSAGALLRHILAPSVFPAWHPDVARTIDDLMQQERFDVVQFNWAEMGQYLKHAKKRDSCVVLCAIDILTTTLYRSFSTTPKTIRKIWLYWYWRNAQLYERLLYPRLDHVLTLSPKDVDYLRLNMPYVKSSVLSPGFSETLIQRSIALNQSKNILFVGNMKRPLNIEGVLWFYNKVFPYIRRQVNDVRFYIVGASPTMEIMALTADEQVTVTGTVDRVESFYDHCRLSIVPLFVGGGIIKKAIDSLAAGCPIVATTIGVEGIDVHHEGEVLIADDAQAFALAVIRLLQDDQLWLQLAHAGRALATRAYAWDTAITQLETIYHRCAVAS